MSDRTLHIRIESTEDLFRRARAIARKIDKGVQLLAYLSKQGPASIRALSKELERDYKSVHGDVTKLMELGLIVKREDGRIEAPYKRIISDWRLAAA